MEKFPFNYRYLGAYLYGATQEAIYDWNGVGC